MAQRNMVLRCGFCGDQVETKKCSICRKAYYCSKECQKADWPNHKEVCKVSDISLSKVVRYMEDSLPWEEIKTIISRKRNRSYCAFFWLLTIDINVKKLGKITTTELTEIPFNMVPETARWGSIRGKLIIICHIRFMGSDDEDLVLSLRHEMSDSRLLAK